MPLYANPFSLFGTRNVLQNVKSENIAVPCSFDNIDNNKTAANNILNSSTLSNQQCDELIKNLKNLNKEVKSLSETLDKKSREILGDLSETSSSSDSSSSDSRERCKKRRYDRCTQWSHSKHHSRTGSCSAGERRHKPIVKRNKHLPHKHVRYSEPTNFYEEENYENDTTSEEYEVERNHSPLLTVERNHSRPLKRPLQRAQSPQSPAKKRTKRKFASFYWFFSKYFTISSHL